MTEVLSRSGLPDASEWHPFHHVSLGHLLPGIASNAAMGHPDDAYAFLKAQLSQFEALPQTIPLDRETFRYAPGKWSVRQLIGHLSDTERILSFRALCAARGDTSPIPPFDEEAYAAMAGHEELPVATLASELVAVRRASLTLFAAFSTEAWPRRGNSGGHSVSARAWAFAIGCHAQLHLNTLRMRYLA